VGLVAMLALGFFGGALLARGRTSPTVAVSSASAVGEEAPRLIGEPPPPPPPPDLAPRIEPLPPRVATPPSREVASRRTRWARVSRLTVGESAEAGANNGNGLCLMSVESKPSKARVWVDEKDTGRKTPLIAYRVPCGSHQLSLRRDDLNLAHSESVNASIVAPLRRTYALR
jgi:hypothetical protein